MTPFPAPNRLHVWWARRPLVASRAAILASLLPADADRDKFLHALGIHGDPVGGKDKIEEARRTGLRVDNPYGYDRAFGYTPSCDEIEWFRKQAARIGFDRPHVLDPTAGGGSIPFETVRLGLNAIGNDLNPVAWLILKATVEFPARFGGELVQRYKQLAADCRKRLQERLADFFPPDPDPANEDATYLWTRTILCPYCGGLVPLSPNWRLESAGTGVRLHPQTADSKARRCKFEIVRSAKEHSAGTIKGGDGLCPFLDCGRVIDGDEIKRQAQAGQMEQQLYAVVFKRTVVVGQTKTGKDKIKTERGFRAPRSEDDVSEKVATALSDKMPEWQARNIIPEEAIDSVSNYDRGHRLYGVHKWQEMFSPRQLLGHCVGVEVFQDVVNELLSQSSGTTLTELDQAALVYIAIALDKMLNYNSRMCVWLANRGVVANTFNRHNFAFQWSHSEMAPTMKGLGYDWTIEQTGKALKELIELTGSADSSGGLFQERRAAGTVRISHGSGDALSLEDASVDCICMDPPYYDNVMYAELADFFYVWLKRTAGLLFPEPFSSHLTDKDREAIANPAKFKGQAGGAKNLAGRDYQERMAAIFRECRRVIKPHGVMIVMFTHKASGAWDALANGLVQAGFVITASWPVNTEAEGSLHIKEKSAAKSTIFLVCRPREARAEQAEAVYWEEVEPQVAAAVRTRVAEFQAAGIGGVDLYLASFGPALQVFSEHWPLKRGRPLQKPKGKAAKLFPDEQFDPYAVNPEDALDAARKEVKRWRMEQLATVKRQHHLDPLTEWFVLAWDAFKAPRFPSDEALKLARVVGLDFDKDVKNVVCEVKSSDVILWDSKTRQGKGKLGPVGEDVMLDTLHHAALIGREQNTGAAQAMLEDAGLLKDSTLLTALEALLNVLPAPGAAIGKKKDDTLGGASSDCEALEKLRRLALSEEVPEPKFTQRVLFTKATDDEDDGDGEE